MLHWPSRETWTTTLLQALPSRCTKLKRLHIYAETDAAPSGKDHACMHAMVHPCQAFKIRWSVTGLWILIHSMVTHEKIARTEQHFHIHYSAGEKLQLPSSSTRSFAWIQHSIPKIMTGTIMRSVSTMTHEPKARAAYSSKQTPSLENQFAQATAKDSPQWFLTCYVSWTRPNWKTKDVILYSDWYRQGFSGECSSFSSFIGVSLNLKLIACLNLVSHWNLGKRITKRQAKNSSWSCWRAGCTIQR